MKMSFESEIGAQPPIGFWDPLGLVADADQERFDRLRYVEIKHGRIAMLAVLGHITQQNYRLPGETVRPRGIRIPGKIVLQHASMTGHLPSVDFSVLLSGEDRTSVNGCVIRGY